MTWFGADKTINWFRPEETEEIESKIEDFLPVILT
jgi:hypothetical protein